MTSLANICWRALLVAENVLVAADTPELQLRAVNAIGQAAAHYCKVCETLDLTARVSQLEEALKRGGRV